MINNPSSFFADLSREVAKVNAVVGRVRSGQASTDDRDFLWLRRLGTLRQDDDLSLGFTYIDPPGNSTCDADDPRCDLTTWVGCDQEGWQAHQASLLRRGLIDEGPRAQLTAYGQAELKRLRQELVAGLSTQRQ